MTCNGSLQISPGRIPNSSVLQSYACSPARRFLSKVFPAHEYKGRSEEGHIKGAWRDAGHPVNAGKEP
jgi:hypothetical protein